MGSKLNSQTDVPSDIPKDLALCLFRITQEALSNVVRHSQAQQAQVELCGIDDELRLRVTDSGLGFNPVPKNPDKGIGLVSMRERLRLLGGRLLIRSEPMQETEIVATVPFALPVMESATEMIEGGTTL